MENKFIDTLIKNKTRIVLYTTNGVQMRGVILRHDDYAIILFCTGKEHLVYKSAISTIVRDD